MGYTSSVEREVGREPERRSLCRGHAIPVSGVVSALVPAIACVVEHRPEGKMRRIHARPVITCMQGYRSDRVNSGNRQGQSMRQFGAVFDLEVTISVAEPSASPRPAGAKWHPGHGALSVDLPPELIRDRVVFGPACRAPSDGVVGVDQLPASHACPLGDRSLCERHDASIAQIRQS